MENIPLLKHINKPISLQNLLALSAVTLVITVWSTVSFLAYQNSLLKKFSKNINTTSITSNLTKNTSENQKPDSWKTYINFKYHYTLKYTDPTFTLTNRSCTAGKPELLEGEDIFVIIPITSAISMKSCFPLEWVADIQVEVVTGDKTTPVSPSWEKLTIGNSPGYKIKINYPESEVGGPTELTEVRIYHNNFTYIIYLGNPEFEKTFDQILSTFQFTE